MIIVRTPFRVSLFGGGTDYPTWYEQNGGAVLSTTIDKYCYISMRKLPPFFEHKHRIVYSQTEDAHTTEEIRHPKVRECLKSLNVQEGLEIHHDGDLPARSGLGTSSSFTVGLLQALYTLYKIPYDKVKLALDAIHIERDVVGENVGNQDQVAVAVGGLNLIDFYSTGKFALTPLEASGLDKWLLLAFTGFARTASTIAGTYDLKSEGLTAMQNMVPVALEALEAREFEKFGHLLGSSWNLKKGLSPEISNPYIDYMYDKAQNAGALGGKILGAGGGGFLLLFAEPCKHEAIKAALKGLLFVPFKFEKEGSQVIFNSEV